MAEVTKVKIEGNQVTALVQTRDIAKVNILRRAILGHIRTFAIEYVTIYDNISALPDETLAFILGQLVIDNMTYQGGDNFSFIIDWSGPERGGQLREITTDDIPELPFRFRTPITMLRRGESIRAQIIVKEGTAVEHCKWRPVANFSVKQDNDGYIISFKEIGMLSGEEILRRGVERMGDAIEQRSQTIFTRHVIWTE